MKDYPRTLRELERLPLQRKERTQQAAEFSIREVWSRALLPNGWHISVAPVLVPTRKGDRPLLETYPGSASEVDTSNRLASSLQLSRLKSATMERST
jgi:hypothetical protein